MKIFNYMTGRYAKVKSAKTETISEIETIDITDDDSIELKSAKTETISEIETIDITDDDSIENEDLLNDDTDEIPDLEEADEDALLQDDEDVLNLVPEEDLGDIVESDVRQEFDDTNDRRSGSPRKDKYATERQRITAPEPVVEKKVQNSSYGRQNNNYNRSRGRGMKHQFQSRYHQYNNQVRQHNPHNQPGRNKTVLINPRFQGIVHVNNHARLAWDTQQPQYQDSWNTNNPPNPNMGPPMQVMQPNAPQMQVPPQMHFPPPQMPPPMPQQQFFPPPPMHQPNQGPPINMQPMHQGPHNMQNNGQPIPFMAPQQVYMASPQPLPPGCSVSPMQAPSPQPMHYGNCNVVIPNQLPPQMPPPNYHFNNSNQPQMQPPPQLQFNQNQNFDQQMQRRVFPKPYQNVAQPKEETTPPKRMNTTPSFIPNKKRFVHERLGTRAQAQTNNVTVSSVSVKTEQRPSVVKEVTVTNVTTVKIEEDEETRDLRNKIEEQKRKREQVLRWKEMRRIENLKKQTVLKPVQPVNRVQPSVRVQPQPHQLGSSMRVPVLQPIKQIQERPQRIVQNRVVTSVPVTPIEPAAAAIDKNRLSAFLAGRKVLAKDESLMATRKVTIKNIATSTGDKKIIQICKSIGDVQKLHRDKNARHATITFKSVASAHAFFKKYQRRMLDLSMIEVALAPESDGPD